MSEISSLADSSEEKEKSLLPAGLSSRKRKRSNLEDRSQNGKKGGNSPGSPHIVESQAYNHPLAEGKERNVKAYTIEINQHPNANGATSPTIEIEASTTQRLSSVKLKSRNGKRKGKKLKDDIFGTLSDAAPSVEAHPEPPGNLEADCSNGEDAEIEDAGDDGEIDTAARNEEGCE